MKRMILLCLLPLLLLTACGQKDTSYTSITAQQAKTLMDTTEDYILLDTRTQEEYEEGHIPGAILIPQEEINETRSEEELPNKDQLILLYCRSGRDSKLAAQTLASLGYTNIREFGDISDWTYEVE